MSSLAALLVAATAGIVVWCLAAWWRNQRIRTRLTTVAAAAAAASAAPLGIDPGSGRSRVPPAALVAAGAGVAGAAALVHPVMVAVAVGAVAVAPLAFRRRQRAQLAMRRARQLPTALDRLASGLRSGSSLTVALDETGRSTPEPLGPELAGLAIDAAHGRPVTAVLDDWTRRHDDPGTRLAATALALATIVGAAPARAIDGVATTLRERHELDAERRALSSQARTSAVVLAAAPPVFALLLGLGDGPAAHFLFGSPVGLTCLVVGVGLDGLGAWWMARLTRGTAT